MTDPKTPVNDNESDTLFIDIIKMVSFYDSLNLRTPTNPQTYADQGKDL